MIKDNKIEPSERSVTSTSNGHNNGYTRYPLRVLQLVILFKDNDNRESGKRQYQESSDIRQALFLYRIGQAALLERMSDKDTMDALDLKLT